MVRRGAGGGVVRVYVVLYGYENLVFAKSGERRRTRRFRLLGFHSHPGGCGEKFSRHRDDVFHDQRGL